MEVLQQMNPKEQICLIHCQIKCIEIHQNQGDCLRNRNSCSPVLADLKELQQLVLKHSNQTLCCRHAGGHALISLCYDPDSLFDNDNLQCKPDFCDDDGEQQHEPTIQYWQEV